MLIPTDIKIRGNRVWIEVHGHGKPDGDYRYEKYEAEESEKVLLNALQRRYTLTYGGIPCHPKPMTLGPPTDADFLGCGQ